MNTVHYVNIVYITNLKLKKMKTIIPITLLLLLSSCTKEDTNSYVVKEFSMQSISNGANYPIKVILPDDYDTNQSYTTLYLLDGDENYHLVAESSRTISNQYAKPNLIIVSIGYGNNRTMDYTPTKANEGGGGADKFLKFIENELIPKVEHDFNADTLRENRIILGHSFGGLFAAYAFTNHNHVFGNYLMLSPSIWYDNEIMLKFESDYRNVNQQNHQFVFMGLGELENEGRMLAPFEAFYLRLKFNYPGIELQKNLVAGLGHVGSKNPNIEESLNFYFKNK